MTEDIRINMFQAGQGDAFIISCGIGEQKKNIMIDGGTGDTFASSLQGFLKELDEQGEKIDLLIVTHIDNDHIGGVIEMLKHNKELGKTKIICIEEVWHNAYLQLQLDKQDQISEHQRRVVQEIKDRGDGSGESEKSEISTRQGSFLGSLLYEDDYNWNGYTDGIAISVENVPVYAFSDDLKLYILSPTNKCLEELGRFWLNELNKRNYIGKTSNGKLFDDAYEMLLRRIEEEEKKKQKEIKSKISSTRMSWDSYLNEVFKEDGKPTNKSSIAFVLEFKEKKLLYLGDAAPSVVEEKLREIYKSEKIPYKFDIVKVSHHGSSGNMSPELLKLIDSDKYLFSTNGKYGHPDLSTLVKIAENYPKKEVVKELIFNYENDSLKWMNSNIEKIKSLNYIAKVSNYEEV
ncbi:MBL fold metallo-hydrolase [Clostridium sp. YIM B02505]|uniref:MBL fold metallo-hydrolase n=1 Tax=Clostridium yunnanense TaxID=2800325 RepID=A0ABS1ERZ7_9CLOT|nr:MBL fold metallo-hydrolase [Clostridium yunnanense]MBK1812151.1 MBL fold metallo-hydrolase [Clostridium yunnanense]